MADAKVVDSVTLEKLTRVYLKIKGERERLSAKFREADDKLVAQQNKIKSALLDHLKDTGAKSVKTDAGTFYRTVKQKYWTSDWESMHKFILEHEVPEFLEKRLHQGAVKGFLEENPDLLPKGLNVDSEYAVTVRKA
jgi:hypothetical protein|tara:strand:+ start:421 stop:831 length:411 start_codon:yes stop_codon:yes gene_type:complete